ncbi:MAG: hypothetical protein ACE5JX_03800 [Acidobacteriota bacterium]
MRTAPHFLSPIARVRRKLQAERLVKGMALVLGFFLAASLLSSYLLAESNFSDSSVFWTRLIGAVLLLGLCLKFLLLPAVRRPSHRRVARFLEEQYPQLEERLSTAIEMERSAARVHPGIRKLLRLDAERKLRRIAQPRLFHPRASLLSLLGVAVSLLVFLVLFFGGPGAYRYSLDKLLRGWNDSQPPLYSIVVQPGDAKVVRHADVEIRASLNGFLSPQVKLLVKYEKQPDWEEAAMRPDPKGNEFVFLFFDVRDQIDYYVESDGIRSDTYTLTVSDIPTVEQLKITLNFPRHTGLRPEVKENDGDIRALTGTRAEFVIKTDQPVRNATLKLEDGEDIGLQVVSPRELKGELKIGHDDFYRIHLENEEGVWNPGSDEYLIEALIDQPPTVSLTRPGRDKKVTNLEEVFTQVKAEDDYGIRWLDLRFSVNGEAEQQVKLDIPRGSRSVTSSHTFYLENFELQPGDFISYFAEAADALTVSRTDIYFLEVEPYDREYYQSQQSGAGAAGSNLILSKLQKEIISATFNVIREKNHSSSKDYEENVQTIALMQQQLKQQAEAIVARIERRGAATSGPMFQGMVERLTEAVSHMETAYQQLNQLHPKEALPPEQKSFQQLLRAESLFKEIQISMGQGQAGGSNASAEDLADLVDLELDKTKNQYETLQQNRQMNRERALDEAAEKLKELARRQQQEAERRRRQATRSSSGAGSSSQDLADEVEELARQLDRLSRRERDQQLNALSRKLRQAARDLRQSGSAQNAQEAQMRAQRALERLQQARDQLNRQRGSELSQTMDRLADQSRQLSQRQEEVLRQMEQLEARQKAQQVDNDFINQMGALMRRKGELQEDVQRLESDLHETARRLASKEPDASRKLKAAGIGVRDHRTMEKMQESSDLLRRLWTTMARQREESVSGDLRQLADQIEQARRAFAPGGHSSPREKGEQALNQIGNLVENLESLRQRLSRQRPGEQGARGEEGNQGEQGTRSPSGGRNPEQQASQGRSPQQGEQAGGQQGRQSGQLGRELNRQGRPVQAGGADAGPPSQTVGSNRSAQRASSFANSSGINPQQVRREWQERVRDAERLRDLMRRVDPPTARELAALARRMRQLDARRLLDNPKEIAALKAQIIDGFRQLELEMYGRLKQEKDGQLRLAYEDEIPPQFRERVEEYYRTLAGERKP